MWKNKSSPLRKLSSCYKTTERYDNFICFLAHRVKNLNVMSENRDKIYDPDPGKGFTFKNSRLDTAPQQDKLHTVSILRVVPLTDTLDHLKDCGKITETISLYVCHCGNVVHDLDHELSKPVDNDAVYVRPGLCVVPPTKNIVSNRKHVWLLTQLENPNLWLAAYDLLCPAGRSGCSCLAVVLAVKWKLDEMSWNNEMKNQCGSDITCTS